jgi:hypothetical protein
VHDEIARLSDAGMFTEEQLATTCCFATQDKVWVTGPGGERREVYTVLADSESFGSSPQHLVTPPHGQAVGWTASQHATASAPLCC